ncbi:MAG: addiction module protein [Gammaproteobacteria bacterium]|nr:addiction module protein [Gammaproteobacteria bacterium]
MSAKGIVDSAKRLPPAEPAAVIEALLDIMDASDPAIDAKWVVEAESRLAAYRAGDLKSVDADEVLATLRK